MALTDKLDQIQARADAASEGDWQPVDDGRKVHIPMPWGATLAHVETTGNAEFIAAAREDVPALVAALRAVLDVLNTQAVNYRQTSDEMCRQAIARDPDMPDADTVIRYAAYASGAESAYRRAHEAIGAALGVAR